MREQTRRGVAYIVGRLAGFSSGGVYDHDARLLVNIAGSVEADAVHVYDYDRGVHLSGERSRNSLVLFDHGHERARLELALRSPGRFVGYDHSTRSLFEIQAQGRAVEVFDFQTRRSHVYSV